jgi:hypothetical protein
MTQPEHSQHASNELARALRAGVAMESGSPKQILSKLLQVVRAHFKMEAAFVSCFEHGRRVFKVVDSEPGA